MGIEKLTKDSTPCEICLEITGEKPITYETKPGAKYCEYKAEICSAGTRAIIKLLYLTYIDSKRD